MSRAGSHHPDSNAAEPATLWHATPAEEVLAALNASEQGLSRAEADRRLQRWGPNRLHLTPPEPAWRILVAQFRSIVVLLLAAAALLSWFLGDPVDSLAILAVLGINTLLGFSTEIRARRAVEALGRLEVSQATVLRDGRITAVPASQLVPGDVALLEEGQSIPADVRLLESESFRTAEAALTGESLPVDKDAGSVLDGETPLADRINMAWMSTAVVGGTARAVVVTTGAATQVGQIGEMTSRVEARRTPLEERLDQLGRRLVGVSLAITALVVIVGVLRGEPFGRMLETGIALAIAAVPEGLPAVATIALAVGVWRMARRNALVRRLPAVETLGSTTIVCTDKTGTLTAGEMTVIRLATMEREIRITGAGYGAEGSLFEGDEPVDVAADAAVREALQIGVRVNRAEVTEEAEGVEVAGDPTEAALIVAGRKAGMDRADHDGESVLGTVPFSSERRWMAVTTRGHAGPITWVKGAPEKLIQSADFWLDRDGEARKMDAGARERFERHNEKFAEDGLRVLCAARAEGEGSGEELPPGLCLVGLFGLQDPPATLVPETVADFAAAGVRTLMITGDQPATAAAVARQLGLLDDTEGQVLTGAQLDRESPEGLAEQLRTAAVLSRVEPADKLRVVEALQGSGEIVAMLGDGVNDAAALKRADVGVAMGRRGTDVAREAASVVLQDDRFATVGAAIAEGRVIFDNIRHFVFYLFSCNVAEVLVILLAGIIGLPQPLLPLQILWLNIVTDTFPALSLAVEPGADDVMQRPPRPPDRAIMSGPFVRSIALYGGLITVSTLAAFLWALGAGHGDAFARTVAFMTLALAQIFHLVNARSDAPVFGRHSPRRNPWSWAAAVLVIGLQALAVYFPPLAGLLDIAPLGLGDWLVVTGFAIIPAVVGQILRALHVLRSDHARAAEAHTV